MRDGRRAVTAPLSELCLATIIEHIIGRASRGLGEIERGGGMRGEALIELRNASGARKPRNVDLAIHRGEVLGATGLLGSGRSSLARLLFGMEPLVAGEILVKGVEANIRSPQDAIAAGIALIPEDRLLEGLIVQHSVGANIVLPVLERVSRYTWVWDTAAAEIIREQIAQLRIKTASAGAAVNTLSGGNQQKVVVGKWLATTPAILVLDEPTAGIDIGAKSEIVRLVRELARAGRAILIISSEMPVLLAACDRIVVMSEGRIVKDIARHELDPASDAGADEGERLRYAERELLMAIQTGAAMAA
jgi:ribose transport system ATP-binding protein